MRRWFVARFYRLGFGSWFDPPTRYVNKAPVDTDILGDDFGSELVESDLVLTSSPLGDDLRTVAGAGDDVLDSSPVGVPQFQNEVDP